LCIEKKHSLSKVLYNRALAYLHMQKLKEASNDLQQLAKIEPDNPNVYYTLGVITSIKQDYKGSLAFYDKAIQLNPSFADAYFNRGVSLGNLDLHRAAIIYYDKAIQLRKDYAEAYYSRAVSKIRTQPSAREGCVDLKKALELGYKQAQELIAIHCN